MESRWMVVAKRQSDVQCFEPHESAFKHNHAVLPKPCANASRRIEFYSIAFVIVFCKILLAQIIANVVKIATAFENLEASTKA